MTHELSKALMSFGNINSPKCQSKVGFSSSQKTIFPSIVPCFDVLTIHMVLR